LPKAGGESPKRRERKEEDGRIISKEVVVGRRRGRGIRKER